MKILLALLLPSLVLANADWGVVTSIAPGKHVLIKLPKETIWGKLVSAGPGEIQIESAKQVRSISKADVRKVSIRSGAGRARNAAIGAAIGFGVGFGAGVLTPGDLNRSKTGPIIGGIGGLIGVGLGALVPGYTTVYQIP